MDTPSCTADLKPSMRRLKDNTRNNQERRTVFTHDYNKRTQFQGLTTLRILISNPDTEIKTIRHPIDKLASTQIGTDIQT